MIGHSLDKCTKYHGKSSEQSDPMEVNQEVPQSKSRLADKRARYRRNKVYNRKDVLSRASNVAYLNENPTVSGIYISLNKTLATSYVAQISSVTISYFVQTLTISSSHPSITLPPFSSNIPSIQTSTSSPLPSPPPSLTPISSFGASSFTLGEYSLIPIQSLVVSSPTFTFSTQVNTSSSFLYLIYLDYKTHLPQCHSHCPMTLS